MQASLEAEAKGKAEALRLKKKLEADINELEIALDHANKVRTCMSCTRFRSRMDQNIISLFVR
jgi:hypothetical protein